MDSSFTDIPDMPVLYTLHRQSGLLQCYQYLPVTLPTDEDSFSNKQRYRQSFSDASNYAFTVEKLPVLVANLRFPKGNLLAMMKPKHFVTQFPHLI